MNVYGQLGNGTIDTISTPHPTPTPVSGLAGVTQVAAGQYHSLALRSNGTVMAWGADAHDQLGNGTSESNSLTPREVVELPLGVTQLSAGSSHSVALVGSSQALVSRSRGPAPVRGRLGDPVPAACLHRYPKGEIAMLRAEPGARTGFAGFTGACTGTGMCTVQMSQDRSVAATFGPPKAPKSSRRRSPTSRTRPLWLSTPALSPSLVAADPTSQEGAQKAQGQVRLMRVTEDLQETTARHIRVQGTRTRHPRRRCHAGSQSARAQRTSPDRAVGGWV